MKSNHHHKVNETRTRSILKALTSKVIEVVVDTALVGEILHLLGVSNAFEIGGSFAVAVEVLCAVTNYFNDRLWNKIQWGREVEDAEETIKDKVEHL